MIKLMVRIFSCLVTSGLFFIDNSLYHTTFNSVNILQSAQCVGCHGVANCVCCLQYKYFEPQQTQSHHDILHTEHFGGNCHV